MLGVVSGLLAICVGCPQTPPITAHTLLRTTQTGCRGTREATFTTAAGSGCKGGPPPPSTQPWLQVPSRRAVSGSGGRAGDAAPRSVGIPEEPAQLQMGCECQLASRAARCSVAPQIPAGRQRRVHQRLELGGTSRAAPRSHHTPAAPPQPGCPADVAGWWMEIQADWAEAEAAGAVLLACDANGCTGSDPDWPE